MSNIEREPAGASLPALSALQGGLLSVLRLAIGWHFLYEGMVKLLDPHWSSAGYLAGSTGPLAGIYDQVLASPALLTVVDQLNIWGLILIGLGLMLGLFTRLAAGAGVALLVLYYLSNPPLIRHGLSLPTEGNYLFIDKNLIELVMLGLIASFDPHRLWGLDRLLAARRSGAPRPVAAEPAPAVREQVPPGPVSTGRREMLKNLVGLPVLGVFALALLKKRGWVSWEERHLTALTSGTDTDATTSATLKTFQFAQLKDLKGKPPLAKIKDLEVSRIILGGNLIGGWAHARDLIYVSKLVKAYHHDDKVFETFRMAEQCGVNTILTNPALCRVINEYWRMEGGKIQFICDCAGGDDLLTGIEIVGRRRGASLLCPGRDRRPDRAPGQVRPDRPGGWR